MLKNFENLHRLYSRFLLSPHPLTNIRVANHLRKNRDLQDTSTITAKEQCIQRLTTCDRNQTLEVNNATISNFDMFQSKEAVVKTHYVTKQDILEGDSRDQSKTRYLLMSEVDKLSRLNGLSHPHKAVLLESKSLEFERNDNLLQFVQASREGNELLPTPLPLKIILDITEALLFLQDRAVMAENVLVGDNYVCKLTGMHSLRQLQKESTDEGK